MEITLPLSEDSDAYLQNNRNHGRRIDGPWVFGLKQGSDFRYFYVQRRDRTLLYQSLSGNAKPVQ
jgi:hypothetical protein